MFTVGITGASSGGSVEQLAALEAILGGFVDLSPVIIHGDASGVDVEAAVRAVKLGYKEIVAPPADGSGEGREGDERLEPNTHFARNREIVSRCDYLIGVPLKDNPRLGGTWYTIDYALKEKVPVCIINRDGSINLHVDGI